MVRRVHLTGRMRSVWRVSVGFFTVLLGGAAYAQEWEVVTRDPFLVKTRDVPGSSVKEYLVEASLGASLEDVEGALRDSAHFVEFIPHVSEAKVLQREGRTEHVYVRVAPPLGGHRDYVSEVTLHESFEDGNDRFHQSWRAEPRFVPERDGVIRLHVNEGSWDIRRDGESRSRVVYRFRVDPGGWVPRFMVDIANREGIPSTLRAIETEAQRRGAARAPKTQGRRTAPAR